MGNILVLIQQEKGKLPKSSLIAVKAAQDLKAAWNCGDILGITFGSGATQAAEEALHYGLTKVLVCEVAELEKYQAGPASQAIFQACTQESCTVFVATATSTGKDLAPCVAALLDAGQASEVLAVNSDGSLKRPMYAGDIFADVEIVTPNKVVTLRSTAFPAAERGSKSGVAVPFTPTLDGARRAEVVSYELSGGDRPELTEAAIVVSGGRALQSAENFEKYIFPLADSLGAAVGASRAAVDSGYAPNDWQVGQTGKVVAPVVYIAVGISGAIQHLAGMKDSKTIVAINKDGDAPIFEIADYGLVADLYDAVPKLTEGIKKAKAG